MSPPFVPLPELKLILPPILLLESPDLNNKDPPDPSIVFPDEITAIEPPSVADAPVLNRISPAIPEDEAPVVILICPLPIRPSPVDT